MNVLMLVALAVVAFCYCGGLKLEGFDSLTCISKQNE